MLLALIAITVFLLDQSSKFLISSRMAVGQSIPVLPGIFHITHTRNPGAAFGLLPNQTWLFILFTLVMLGLLFYYVRQERGLEVSLLLALGLELGGAVGNLVDRLRFGIVVDFLDFRVWPVFNVADIGIVVGGFLLAWHLLRDTRTPS